LHRLIDTDKEETREERPGLRVIVLIVEESETNKTHEDGLSDLDSKMSWISFKTSSVAPHKKLNLL
jgi:hypothetical protein